MTREIIDDHENGYFSNSFDLVVKSFVSFLAIIIKKIRIYFILLGNLPSMRF